MSFPRLAAACLLLHVAGGLMNTVPTIVLVTMVPASPQPGYSYDGLPPRPSPNVVVGVVTALGRSRHSRSSVVVFSAATDNARERNARRQLLDRLRSVYV